MMINSAAHLQLPFTTVAVSAIKGIKKVNDLGKNNGGNI